MSGKDHWGKSILYGAYDAAIIVTDLLLHPSISELVVELPEKTWVEVMEESLKETMETEQ